MSDGPKSFKEIFDFYKNFKCLFCDNVLIANKYINYENEKEFKCVVCNNNCNVYIINKNYFVILITVNNIMFSFTEPTPSEYSDYQLAIKYYCSTHTIKFINNYYETKQNFIDDIKDIKNLYNKYKKLEVLL